MRSTLRLARAVGSAVFAGLVAAAACADAPREARPGRDAGDPAARARAVVRPVDAGVRPVDAGVRPVDAGVQAPDAVAAVGRSDGGGRARRAEVPSMATADPEVVGVVDPTTIRRVVRRNLGRVRHCYERALRATPGLAGRVVTSFTVTSAGAVTDVSADGVSPEVAGCVAGVLASLVFPARDDGDVVVRYPFVFSPDDD